MKLLLTTWLWLIRYAFHSFLLFLLFEDYFIHASLTWIEYGIRKGMNDIRRGEETKPTEDLSIYLNMCIRQSWTMNTQTTLGHQYILEQFGLQALPTVGWQIGLSLSLSIYLSIYPSIYLSIYLSICLSASSFLLLCLLLNSFLFILSSLSSLILVSVFLLLFLFPCLTHHHLLFPLLLPRFFLSLFLLFLFFFLCRITLISFLN